VRPWQDGRRHIIDYVISHPILTLIIVLAIVYVVRPSALPANTNARWCSVSANTAAPPGQAFISEWQMRFDLHTITTDPEQQEGVNHDNVPIEGQCRYLVSHHLSTRTGSAPYDSGVTKSTNNHDNL
jgi:hypothetical protein